jgi:hypothetical protein
MKTQNDIRKLEERLNSLLMINDVQIGTPISKEKYAPLSGYEYDAITHTMSLIVPARLNSTFTTWFMKQGLENINYHRIENSSYMKILVYL